MPRSAEPDHKMADAADERDKDNEYKVTHDELIERMKVLRLTFDVVRVVDYREKRVIEMNEDGSYGFSDYHCFHVWNRSSSCIECISAQAMIEKTRVSKFETDGKDIFAVISQYYEVDGRPMLLETVKCMDNSTKLAKDERSAFVNVLSEYRSQLYVDSLTRVHSRRYYDDIIANEKITALAILDIDNFKDINDTYGHTAGDEVLRMTGSAVQLSVYEGDCIRYGGDEFLIVFYDADRQSLDEKLNTVVRNIRKIHLDGAVGMTVTASIGGVYAGKDGSPASRLIDCADRELYRAKRKKDMVCTTEIQEI